MHNKEMRYYGTRKQRQRHGIKGDSGYLSPSCVRILVKKQRSRRNTYKNTDAARGLERIFQMAKKQADTLEDLMVNLETGESSMRFASPLSPWVRFASPLRPWRPEAHLVCERLSPSPALDLSLSLHRQPYLYIPPSSRFIRYNNKRSTTSTPLFNIPPLSSILSLFIV